MENHAYTTVRQNPTDCLSHQIGSSSGRSMDSEGGVTRLDDNPCTRKRLKSGCSLLF